MSQILAMAQRIESLEKDLSQSNPAQAGAEGCEPLESSLQRQTPIPSGVGLSSSSNTAMTAQHYSPVFPTTSAVQEPMQGDAETATLPTPQSSEVLVSDPEQISLWETRALEACSEQLRIPLAKVKHLFRTYWTWIYPAFMFVSRPVMLRNMATGSGAYKSALLSSVICLHATRFTDHTLGEELHAHVRFLLGREMHDGPSVPLVQALLQLSARELGLGLLHQAWLYSGMAFRLISDMGILNKTSTPNTHDPSEEHALGQLGWSCYLWDKAVSLYLGRMPSLPEPPMFEPTVLDGHIEYEQWSPYYGPEQHGNKMNNGNNLCHPTPALGATCFVNFCKLGPIIHEILATLYAKKPDPNMLPFVQTTMLRLETWRSESPAELRYDGRSTTCPPPHVLSQK